MSRRHVFVGCLMLSALFAGLAYAKGNVMFGLATIICIGLAVDSYEKLR